MDRTKLEHALWTLTDNTSNLEANRSLLHSMHKLFDGWAEHCGFNEKDGAPCFDVLFSELEECMKADMQSAIKAIAEIREATSAEP